MTLLLAPILCAKLAGPPRSAGVEKLEPGSTATGRGCGHELCSSTVRPGPCVSGNAKPRAEPTRTIEQIHAGPRTQAQTRERAHTHGDSRTPTHTHKHARTLSLPRALARALPMRRPQSHTCTRRQTCAGAARPYEEREPAATGVRDGSAISEGTKACTHPARGRDVSRASRSARRGAAASTGACQTGSP